MSLAPQPPLPPKNRASRKDDSSDSAMEENNFSVSAAKAFFEAAKKPEVQRAAAAAANNPTVRNAAISAAQNPQTRNQIMGVLAAQQNTNSTRTDVPVKARSSTTGSDGAPPPPPHRGSSVSTVPPPAPPKKPSSKDIYGYDDAPAAYSSLGGNRPVPTPSTSTVGYSSLVAELQSVQLKSPSGGPSTVNRPTTSYAPPVQPSPPANVSNTQSVVLPPPPNRPPPMPTAAQYSNQTAPKPSRPPPPKAQQQSPTSYTPTTEPHALVKYPITASHFDELSCSVGDAVILKKEVDDQWIYGMNTRTGSHGIVPFSFLDIKIPLVPSQPSYAAQDGHMGVALYDYDSQTQGDLRFRANDHIRLIEWIDSDWLFGECRGQQGILPANFISAANLNTLPYRQQQAPVAPLNINTVLATMYAAYDYNSGVAEDLILRVGDKVEMLEYVGTDWIRGRCRHMSGMVPFNFLSSQMKKSPSSLADSITAMARTEQIVTAIDDHQTHDETNLYFSRGDQILIVKEVNELWYMGKLQEFKSLPAGLVPKNKVV